jgi:hypothetical protein
VAYEGGAILYINYNDAPAALDGVDIPAGGCVVKGGAR